MPKRYYWLKLKEDFFEDETIRYIEEQENGIRYSNFYLKLCLKSLRTNGKLIRLVGEMLIPYDAKSLAALTNVDVDTVRCAMALFEQIGCIKVLDGGELFISQLSELVGSETDKAKLMRESRARKSVDGNNVTAQLPDVTQQLPECYIELEKEKDLELELEQERKEAPPPAAENLAIMVFRQNIGEPSDDQKSEVEAWAYEMTTDVVVRAIREAVSSGVPKWAYARSILKDKKKRGVRCIEDWDKLQTGASNRPQKVPAGSAGTAPLGDLERQALNKMLGGESNA